MSHTIDAILSPVSLGDLASVGAFISGIAVLASLIFLNYQLRQTARHQRSLLLQGQATRWHDLQLELARPEMGPVWDNTADADRALTIHEFRQVRHLVTAYFKSGEESFIQRRDGLLTESAFEAVRHILTAFLGFPRVRVIWRQSRLIFDADYARLVDGLLEEAPLYSASTVLAEFNRAVLAEIAVSEPDPAVSGAVRKATS